VISIVAVELPKTFCGTVSNVTVPIGAIVTEYGPSSDADAPVVGVSVDVDPDSLVVLEQPPSSALPTIAPLYFT
jgi:hypothetical protein